jgi:hypothetical protein
MIAHVLPLLNLSLEQRGINKCNGNTYEKDKDAANDTCKHGVQHSMRWQRRACSQIILIESRWRTPCGPLRLFILYSIVIIVLAPSPAS